VKLKISFLILLLLFCNWCLASDLTLKETLDWLKKTIPQYTVEDRSDDFNRFFGEDTECSPATSPSFWELSYDGENLCNLTVMLKDMRKTDTVIREGILSLCEASNLPVFADGDTRHGNVTNIQRPEKWKRSTLYCCYDNP